MLSDATRLNSSVGVVMKPPARPSFEVGLSFKLQSHMYGVCVCVSVYKLYSEGWLPPRSCNYMPRRSTIILIIIIAVNITQYLGLNSSKHVGFTRMANNALRSGMIYVLAWDFTHSFKFAILTRPNKGMGLWSRLGYNNRKNLHSRVLTWNMLGRGPMVANQRSGWDMTVSENHIATVAVCLHLKIYEKCYKPDY